jgi:hypothetical protein
MLLIITIGIAVTFLLVLIALYIITRADKWDRLFLRQLEFSSPTGKASCQGLTTNTWSVDTNKFKARDLTLPMEISDNGGRRSGIERRAFPHLCQVPKRWTGPDRRLALDRRSGLDRRNGITMRRGGKERRIAF